MIAGSLSGLFLLAAPVLSQAAPAYLPAIQTEADFDVVASKSSSIPGVERSTKLIVPVRDGDPDLLPVLFQNVNVHAFHQEFLKLEFPEKFPGLDGPGYQALCERRASRKYFACVLYGFEGPEASFGFDVFTGDLPEELPRVEEVRWIFERLAAKVSIGTVAYSPFRPAAIHNAEAWTQPGFPIDFAFGGGFGPYLAYTRGESFGRVKILSPAELLDANGTGAFSAQDIVVLDEAPGDLEGVIAGVITGSIQEELSHLSIRSGRRGTPNAYVRDARSAFAPFEGKLIRLRVGESDYEAEEASLVDAEAWWAAHRPSPVAVPELDREYGGLDAASEIPLDGSLALNGRYGGKGANFGRLWHIVPEANRDGGFVVPMRYYFEYLEKTRVESRVNPSLRVTLAEYIADLVEDPAFRGDSRVRFAELEKLRELFEDGNVDTVLVRQVATKVEEVFGRTDGKVRFRSSSNAEHLLEFNGAGLYESTWACAADDLDTGSGGPSLCDAEESKERGIGRGLKRVWGSLWSFRGFEERDYFRIPQDAVGMAVLVSESFGDNELANAVAFTGNPAVRGSPRYFVSCQEGDAEIALPPPGVESEQNLLTIVDGAVTEILRARRSSLVPVGEHVLSDEQLREAGKVMALIERSFPFDPGSRAADEVLRDIELKVASDGRLVFKDVRLFVIVSSEPPAREFRLTVPAGTTLCGSFVEGRPAIDVLRRKLRVGVRGGQHVLSTDGTSVADLFEWLELGPGGPRLEPLGPGVWEARRSDQNGRVHGFAMEQDFLNGADPIRLTLENLTLRDDGPSDVSLDALDFTWGVSPRRIYVKAEPGDPPDVSKHEDFLPCDLSHLPEYTVDVELAGGARVRLEERFQDIHEGTGPAELVRAEVSLEGIGGESRTVEDYWRLVYTAGHHNDSPYPEYWILFDPAMPIPGIGVAVGLQVVQGSGPPKPATPPEAYLLGDGFSRIGKLEIASLTRSREGLDLSSFRRGDVDFDGQLRISDPIVILRSLFLGVGTIPCLDAADIDDLGTVDISDPILLLEFLFLGADPPPAPFPGCGHDEGADSLPACNGPGCR